MNLKTLIGVSLCFVAVNSYGQQIISSAGGSSGSGSNGSASFSMGHLELLPVSSNGGSVSGSVQQPFEVFEVTSTNNKEFESLKLYPNPAYDKVIINSGVLSNISNYQITNINGKVVNEAAVSSNSTEINVSNLSQGTYFIHVNTNNNSTKTYKLIKK